MPRFKLDFLVPDQLAETREEAVLKGIAWLMQAGTVNCTTEAPGHELQTIAVHGEPIMLTPGLPLVTGPVEEADLVV